MEQTDSILAGRVHTVDEPGRIGEEIPAPAVVVSLPIFAGVEAELGAPVVDTCRSCGTWHVEGFCKALAPYVVHRWLAGDRVGVVLKDGGVVIADRVDAELVNRQVSALGKIRETLELVSL